MAEPVVEKPVEWFTRDPMTGNLVSTELPVQFTIAQLETMLLEKAADKAEIARLTELLEEAKGTLVGIAEWGDAALGHASCARDMRSTARATLANLEAQPLQRREKRDDARPMPST